MTHSGFYGPAPKLLSFPNSRQPPQKCLDSLICDRYNQCMKIILRKRAALLFISLLFVIALIPAFHWAEDDGLGENCSVCRTYGQLFSISSPFTNIDLGLFWIRISSSIEIVCILPNALPFSSESRAPPA